MEKRILLIGNTEGLPGVKVDIESYKAFFKSSYGGDWYDREIIVKLDPSRTDLKAVLSDLRERSLDYLVVLFSGHGGQERETVLELNASGECVNESELKNLAARQLNIFDCCRAYPQRVTEGVVNQLKTRTFSRTDTRARFEQRIMQAPPQQISLYACKIGEYAHDTADGGAYSKYLLSAAEEVDGAFKLVGVAHQEASVLTSIEFPDQHPEADLLRLQAAQQLIISIKP